MLLAYTGTTLTKDQVIERVRRHRAADELVFGMGWNGHQGCAVGCTLEDYDHRKYPETIGVPEELAHLQDAIFEGLGRTDQRELGLAFPEDFLSAIPEGADLSMVWPRWALWMLRGLPEQKSNRTGKSIDGVISLYDEWLTTGTKPAQARWEAAGAVAAAVAAAVAEAAAWAAVAAARWAAEAEADFWKNARTELLRLLSEAPVVKPDMFTGGMP